MRVNRSHAAHATGRRRLCARKVRAVGSPSIQAGLGGWWDYPPRGDQERGASHQVHRRQQHAGRGVLRDRQGSACGDHCDHGGCDEDGAHPTAGAPNGEGEQALANGEGEKCCQDNKDDADLGYQRARDRERYARGTSHAPERGVHKSRCGRSSSRSFEQRTALHGWVETVRPGRRRSTHWFLQN